MNNDLISRSALLEAIDAEFFKTDPMGEEQLGFLKCRRIARTAPAVDAEPVQHGRWIPSTVKNILHFKCSECSEYMEAVWMANFDYVFCPNCGAKMDAEVEG